MKFKLPSLAADDIFISYSRKDANTYAVGLADELTKKGFSCFFDRLGTEANQNLPPSLIKKIKSCTMLVVVGSPAAARSGFVSQEIEEFTSENGTTRVVPVDFGGASAAADWHPKLVGIAPEFEDLKTLESGDPSDSVVSRVEKSFNYARSKDRLRRYTVGAAAALVLLLLAGFGAAIFAAQQLAEARRATGEANDAKAAAEQARTEAGTAQDDAREQRRLADVAAGEARDAVRRAEEETARAQTAETNAKQAQELAAAAKADAVAAQADAVEQRRLADVASAAARDERLKAEREASNAKAAGLVAVARGMADTDPLTASLLLTEADSSIEPSGGVPAARELLDRYVTKVTLRGHEKGSETLVGIYDAAFSPDGTRVVTAGSDGTARVWANDRSGRSVVLRGHEREVLTARFSPDGERVLTASKDGTARVWRADGTGSPVVLSGESGPEGALFSPDGRRVLAYGGEVTAVWNADGTGRPVEFRHPDYVSCAVFSPDGSLIATGSGDGLGRVWRADGTGTPVILRGGDDSVVAADFSPDGRLVAMGSLKGGGRVWRVDGTGEAIVLGRPRWQVQIVKFSPDGRRVAIMPLGEVLEIWAADGTGQPVRIPPPGGTGGPATSVSFSKDGKLILISWHNGLAELWNADGTGTPVALRGHEGSISAAAFSPDEREVLTASYDATARVWTRSDRDEPVILRGEPNFEARFSPDGRRVVAAERLSADDYSDEDEEEADGDDERRAAEFPILVWNADGTGEPLVLLGHTGSVAVARFSPDGTRVLSGSFDGTARVFSLDGRTPPVLLADNGGPVRRADFSPDGTRVFAVTDQVIKNGFVSNSDGFVRVWNADGTGTPVVLRGHEGGISSASFSPDGRRIVTAGDDGTVRVWPADGAGEAVVLRNHKYKATDARFDPTGRRIASVAEDDRAVIQNADGTGQPLVWDAEVNLKHVEFSPDGKRVAILAEQGREVFIWPADGGAVYTLRGHTSFVGTVKFSPDGRYVVTTSPYDGTARLWLADGTGEPLVLRAGGDRDAFWWAEFSPDQTRVLTVNSSNRPGIDNLRARVWTVGWKELVARLRGRTAECLTVEQRLKYLGESEAEAAARFKECEAGFGRGGAAR